jgi:putative toxin-antitoxin system antitoxin component (TIGR02293 family)
MIEALEEGFPYSAMMRLQRRSGLPATRIAELINVPTRTLMRRKASGRFLPDESERLLRLSNVFERAVDLFEGDLGEAVRWLSNPVRALDGQAPFEFARTEVGAREVEDVIGRLQHGVFT